MEENTKINWEQRRYEIAKAVLAGYTSNEAIIDILDIPTRVKYAVMTADKLINELKNSGK